MFFPILVLDHTPTMVASVYVYVCVCAWCVYLSGTDTVLSPGCGRIFALWGRDLTICAVAGLVERKFYCSCCISCLLFGV